MAVDPRDSGGSGSVEAHAPGTGRDPFERVGSRTLGMWIFLVTLGTLFTASMAGYVIMLYIMKARRTWVDEAGIEQRVPAMPDLPHLPHLLWASTVVILVSSVTIQWALASIRRGKLGGLRIGLGVTLVLGLVFLGLQAFAWVDWFERAVNVEQEHQTYRFAVTAFLILSMLHAAHIVGGLLPMAYVFVKSLLGGGGGAAARGDGAAADDSRAAAYTAQSHGGVHNITLYWHFLDGVWLIMFAALLIFT